MRLAWAAVFVLACALLVAPWFGHFDDTDAQLYQVVVRKMVERRNWLDPSYLDHFAAHFRDHLPFGLWPFTAAQIVFGEHAPRVVAGLFSVAILAWTAGIGTKLLGEWPALIATLTLAATETFFRYGAEIRLDPLLVLLANAAALPALFGTTRRGPWIAATLFAALAVLVKGPFGLVPLVAAAVARTALDRSAAVLVRAVLVAALACVPIAAFLLLDRAVLHAGWWEAYGQRQLFASATGARTDGSTEWWFPFATIAGRFWPGLAVIAVGVLAAIVRRGAPRPVLLFAIFSVVMLGALCLPGRKVWNHAVVAYPGLALLAGALAMPASTWLVRHSRAVAVALAGAAVVAVIATPAIGRAVDRDPCVGSVEFRAALERLQPGDPILVVSSPTSWKTLASLAAERRLEPDPLASLPAPPRDGALALVQDGLDRGAPPGWTRAGHARGWTLLESHVAR